MKVRIASTFPSRLRGLLGRQDLIGPDEVLLLTPCRSIHTYFMRRRIDVAFLDVRGNVVMTSVGLPPGKTMSCKCAVAVLERYSKNESWVGEIPVWAPDDDSGWLRCTQRIELGNETLIPAAGFRLKEGLCATGAVRGVRRLAPEKDC